MSRMLARSAKGGDGDVVALHALDAAAVHPHDDRAVSRLVQLLMDIGVDGVGPLKSAREYAADARSNTRTSEAAVSKVARTTVVRGAIGGFVTSVGGFVTMPVALPLNVAEFYVQATRMVASVAVLRGYDIDDPMVRTAILLTLVGSDADEVLAKAGLATGGGRMVSLATRQLPAGRAPDPQQGDRLPAAAWRRRAGLREARPRSAPPRRSRGRRHRHLDDEADRRPRDGRVPAPPRSAPWVVRLRGQ